MIVKGSLGNLQSITKSMYAELFIESLQCFKLVLQRSRNGVVNRLQNFDDTLLLFYSFFEIEKLLGCDNHTGFGYSGLVRFKRVKRASGNTGLGADVGNAFTVLIEQDEFPLLFGGIFHRSFLLNER